MEKEIKAIKDSINTCGCGSIRFTQVLNERVKYTGKLDKFGDLDLENAKEYHLETLGYESLFCAECGKKARD